VYIEFLVEEFSAEAALEILLPKILPQEFQWRIQSFRGKTNLLQRLPKILAAYRAWVPEDHRFVVLIDRDRDDCKILKAQLEDIASRAGFTTQSTASSTSFQVLNRIVIEELEAWFFGDIQAICAAYPRVSGNLAQQERFRDSDAISGGTWEALEQVLQSAGYHPGGLEKVRAAREIALHMNPNINRSTSFQTFYSGLLQMLS
jgi:hypothetical protein